MSAMRRVVHFAVVASIVGAVAFPGIGAQQGAFAAPPDDKPGNSGDGPGQTDPPGNSGDAPGQNGTPGNSEDAPGQDVTPPSETGTPPGQVKDTLPPGTPPAVVVNPPGLTDPPPPPPPPRPVDPPPGPVDPPPGPVDPPPGPVDPPPGPVDPPPGPVDPPPGPVDPPPGPVDPPPGPPNPPPGPVDPPPGSPDPPPVPPVTSVVDTPAPSLVDTTSSAGPEPPPTELPATAPIVAVAGVQIPPAIEALVAEVLSVASPVDLPVVVTAIAEPEPVLDPPAPAPQVAVQPVAPAPVVPPAVQVPARAQETLNTILDNVPGLLDLSTNIGVLGTNLLLAILAVLCLLLATTFLNATLKENADTMSFSMPAVLHLGSLSIEDLPAPLSRVIHLLRPVFLLLATALIYGALDPNFGFNDTTLVLVTGIGAGLILTTFLFEGGQVLVASRTFHNDARMQLFPVALIIAALSVLLTRLTAFHPGVIFGFVGAAYVAASGQTRRDGMIVWIPLVGLFLVSLFALVLISPLREWSAGRDDVWSSIPETIAVAVFVGGGQSVLLSLLPLTFNDGRRVWDWSRIAWFALAVPASFIFFHALINPDSGINEVAQQTKAVVMLAICVGLLLMSFLVWAYFWLRTSRMERGGHAEA